MTEMTTRSYPRHFLLSNCTFTGSKISSVSHVDPGDWVINNSSHTASGMIENVTDRARKRFEIHESISLHYRPSDTGVCVFS